MVAVGLNKQVPLDLPLPEKPLPEERELIQQAMVRACDHPLVGRTYFSRTDLVQLLFGCDVDTARRLCWKYGFDPDE